MIKKIFITLLLFVSTLAGAGDLPAGYVGRVLNNAANTWQHYSFNYTPGAAGANYVMLAFRQDPAYWYVDNVKVSTNGGTNLLTNGNMTTGGTLSVQTANYGQMYISAPSAWGVTYQAGVYPAAAGMWSNGQWIDGAVGSYDGIYQGVTMTAGTTYVIEFDVMGNSTATPTTTEWQLAVYAGGCENMSMAPTSCTLPSSSGFTTVAQPSATYSAGCTDNCPPPPGPSLCCGGSADPFNANANNTAKVSAFINRLTADSKVNVEQIGNFNIITIQQTGTKDNYVKYSGTGDSNNINISQSGNHSTQVNYTDLAVNGNNNTANLTQSSTGGGKGIFAVVSGGSNNLIIQQRDSGSHYAEINLSGGSKSVDLTQQGSAGHMARITLTGQPVGLTLTQSGGTQQFYSINYNCATAGGCAAISVTQGQ